MNHAQRMAAIFAEMRFCPLCGKEIRKFGTEMKICDDHGTLKVTGKRKGSVLGVALELFEQ